MPDTKDNLAEAFAGESQAFQKYTSYAEKAEKDGFPNIAKLFRTTAQAERIHAAGHLNALDKLEQAEKEGHKANRMFGYAVAAEEVHARCYKAALEAVAAGKDLEEGRFYLCPVCGHIEFGTPPDKCPICGAKAAAYVEV